jgi:hypothetical protein
MIFDFMLCMICFLTTLFIVSSGTSGSIGNLAGTNIVSRHPEQVVEVRVEENNDDVV